MSRLALKQTIARCDSKTDFTHLSNNHTVHPSGFDVSFNFIHGDVLRITYRDFERTIEALASVRGRDANRVEVSRDAKLIRTDAPPIETTASDLEFARINLGLASLGLEPEPQRTID